MGSRSSPQPERTTASVRPGYRGFLAFCKSLDSNLAPFQKTIARAVFDAEREIVAVLPRGSAKSTTAALLAVHHVLTTPRPSVYVGAGSREQARVIGRMIERLARHPALKNSGLQIRHDELRTGLRETVLQVVPADGARAHGWERPTLLIGDEVWSWNDREPTLLGAMATSLIKNPQAKLVLISTAASTLDSQLGRLRARALALPDVQRDGARLEARGDGLRWLEWSVPDDAKPDDLAIVKAANPAPWITKDALRQQRARVTTVEWAQFHQCRWGVGTGAWLPPGAWAACAADYEVEAGTEVIVGVDVGGSRDGTAVVAVDLALRVVHVEVHTGDEAVLEVRDVLLEVLRRHPIREVVYDPWRYQSEAVRLERELGLSMVQFPQSHARMTVASERLHAAVLERRLQHPNDAELNIQVTAAIAKDTGRGWRLDKARRDQKIDLVIALAMANERAQQPPTPSARLLGYI